MNRLTRRFSRHAISAVSAPLLAAPSSILQVQLPAKSSRLESQPNKSHVEEV